MIAQQVADNKNTSDITPLFSKGKEITVNRSNTLICDGAPNFKTAFNRVIYKQISNNKTVNHIRLQGDHNNNKMECMYEVRWRENDELTKESGYPYTQGFTDMS